MALGYCQRNLAKDGVVRAIRVKTPNGKLERAAQQPYPLEVRYDVAEKEKTVRLNPDGTRFESQPTGDAAVAARWKIREVAQIHSQLIEQLTVVFH